MAPLAVVGSRDFANLELVRRFVRSRKPDTVIVSGGTSGVDTAAVDEAILLGRPYEVIPADWARYGRSAGPRRNEQLVRSVDAVVAFWDGRSRGTRHAFRCALAQGKPVWLFDERGRSVSQERAT
jgi:hypothetical protein